MVRALYVTPLGGARPTNTKTDLASLQFLVDGPIEGVTLRDCHLYCNEEGKRRGLTPNYPATKLAHALGWPVGDVLRGPVIFLGGDGAGGEADVPDSVVQTWRRLVTSGES